jgi:hypothetical protein
MNWKLIVYIVAGVSAGTLLLEFFSGAINPLLIGLSAVVALIGAALLSWMLRIGARKKPTDRAG